MIDLRSDTITQPTPEMRRAMAEADVGDDVLGDDPTVAELEQATAELLGFEAGVYMPSGTMTNQVALRAHTEPGDEMYLEAEAHMYYYEAGAPAGLSGVMCRLIPGRRGLFHPDDLRAAIRGRNIHFPKPKLLALENTHNRGGGSVWPMDLLRDVCQTAEHEGLKRHLDGARIWNAAAALGVEERAIAECFDSVSVCFSKGLGAPVGSCLAGSKVFIDRARRFRKMFGGGMRQAGIIAAGALYALRHHRQRLTEDHDNARRLAEAVAAIPACRVDLDGVETNIVTVFLEDVSGPDAAMKLDARGVRLLATGPDRLRAVTSLAVTGEQIDEAAEAFRQVLG